MMRIGDVGLVIACATVGFVWRYGNAPDRKHAAGKRGGGRRLRRSVISNMACL